MDVCWSALVCVCEEPYEVSWILLSWDGRMYRAFCSYKVWGEEILSMQGWLWVWLCWLSLWRFPSWAGYPSWTANARLMSPYSLAMSRRQRRSGINWLRPINMNSKHKSYWWCLCKPNWANTRQSSDVSTQPLLSCQTRLLSYVKMKMNSLMKMTPTMMTTPMMMTTTMTMNMAVCPELQTMFTQKAYSIMAIQLIGAQVLLPLLVLYFSSTSTEFLSRSIRTSCTNNPAFYFNNYACNSVFSTADTGDGDPTYLCTSTS